MELKNKVCIIISAFLATVFTAGTILYLADKGWDVLKKESPLGYTIPAALSFYIYCVILWRLFKNSHKNVALDICERLVAFVTAVFLGYAVYWLSNRKHIELSIGFIACALLFDRLLWLTQKKLFPRENDTQKDEHPPGR
ncbi:MAG TPA: hypothetical protein V6C65_38915 [Allocoleopsis sp.]